MFHSIIIALLLYFSFAAGIEVGFYSKTCPNAEKIVTSVVKEASKSDSTLPAALLRLHYHDCFVQGCDGSILIAKGSNEEPENSSPHHAGLRGLDFIESAKNKLENECRGIVSCADIVALAARDAIALSQGPFYQVPTGRRDGRVSKMSDAQNMPEVGDSMELIKAKFAEKGLSEKDLVLLPAAHTIGTTACFFVENRLYDFPSMNKSDPLISSKFLPELKSKCPKGEVNNRVSLDHGSEKKFDTKILKNIKSGFGVIGTDAGLYIVPSLKALVDSYIGTEADFRSDFVEAIVKMGLIGIKTGEEGEIRRVCSQFN